MGIDDLQLGRLGRMESIKHGGAETLISPSLLCWFLGPRSNHLEKIDIFLSACCQMKHCFLSSGKTTTKFSSNQRVLGKNRVGRSGAAAWNLDGTAPARTQPGTHGEGPNGWPVCDRIWRFPIGVP